MSKNTKNSMAVRQHMEAADKAAEAYYKEDSENRAVFQILVEREDENDLGSTGCQCMGYGSLLTSGIDNALSNCEGFRHSVILAISRRAPLLGMALIAEFSKDSDEEEE